MESFHRSVLLKEVVEFLQIKPGETYIDTTLGGGGHTVEILNHGGRVLGIDFDQEAIEYVQDRIKNHESRIKGTIKIVRGNFRDIDRIAKENGSEKVSGILFDLGVSSHQLDAAERGFSFQKEGPLDMRMDADLTVSARDLINGLTKGELYELFSKLGEEYRARAISDNITRARGIKPIETTGELVEEIAMGRAIKDTAIHPATKVFQALRVAVNDELNNIRVALPKTLDLLKIGGRILAISFHSLEDRIVKNQFIEFEKSGFGKIVTKKPIIPSRNEVEQNVRARSAKLRVFEKG